jgi:hypothetical protein
VDETGAGLCAVAKFGIISDEPSVMYCTARMYSHEKNDVQQLMSYKD